MEVLFGQTAVNQVYFCPPGTSASRVATLSAAFKAITAEPAVSKAFIADNLTPGFLSQAQVTAAVKSDVAEEPGHRRRGRKLPGVRPPGTRAGARYTCLQPGS